MCYIIIHILIVFNRGTTLEGTIEKNDSFFLRWNCLWCFHLHMPCIVFFFVVVSLYDQTKKDIIYYIIHNKVIKTKWWRLIFENCSFTDTLSVGRRCFLMLWILSWHFFLSVHGVYVIKNDRDLIYGLKVPACLPFHSSHNFMYEAKSISTEPSPAVVCVYSIMVVGPVALPLNW